MPDKVRFFVWRQDGRIVAFAEWHAAGKGLYAEYIGLDYAVAIDLTPLSLCVSRYGLMGDRNGYKDSQQRPELRSQAAFAAPAGSDRPMSGIHRKF